MSLSLAEVMSKSQAKINTLKEPLKTAATVLVEQSYSIGIYVIITEALRTYEYQNSLYAKGRNTAGKVIKPSEVVTNARGGFSNHNFGYAFDFALLMRDGRTIKWDTRRSDNLDALPDWGQVVAIAKKMGLEWGGDWRSFTDLPHLQMVFGLSTAQYRAGIRPAASEVSKALAKINSTFATPIQKEPEQKSLAYSFTAGGKEAGIAFLEENTTYVPLVKLADYIGVPYEWDNEEKTAYINNNKLSDAKIIEGRAYVQLRPIAESYGKTVVFDKKNKITGVA